MPDTYAQIQNGVIINTILAGQKDFFDPKYQWCDITLYSPQPYIGWITQDGINFTNPNPSPPPPTQVQILTSDLTNVVINLSQVINDSSSMNAADIATAEQNALQQNQQSFTPNELTMWQSLITYVGLDGGPGAVQGPPSGQTKGL
jgi:hypothetical protein